MRRACRRSSADPGPAPLSGELLALRPGSQVEIFRHTSKDRPAWVGPATVKVTDVEHGKIMVQWQGRPIEVPLEGVRRAMIFATFFFDGSLQAFPTYPHTTIQMARHALEHIRNRSVLLGWIQSGVAWLQTRETKAYNDVVVALLYIAQNLAWVPNVTTGRLASGVKSEPPGHLGLVHMRDMPAFSTVPENLARCNLGIWSGTI